MSWRSWLQTSRRNWWVLATAALLIAVTVAYFHSRPTEEPAPMPGFTQEFLERRDGAPLVEKSYGFKFGKVQISPPDDLYPKLTHGEVNLISGFGTSGCNVPRNNFVNLEDDRNCFPDYDAVPLIRIKFLTENEWIAGVLSRISGKLDQKQMIQLNHRVAICGTPIAEAAKDWLASLGLERPKDRESLPTGRVIIGSKDFTESMILAEIIAQAIETASDCEVVRRINFGGTVTCFQALSYGEIDLYTDYNGTLWNLLQEKDDAEMFRRDLHTKELTRRLKRDFGLKMLESLGFENKYTITMKKSLADELGIKTISDLAEWFRRTTPVLPDPKPTLPSLSRNPDDVEKERLDREEQVVAPLRRKVKRMEKERARSDANPCTDLELRARKTELKAEESRQEALKTELDFLRQSIDLNSAERNLSPAEEMSRASESIARLQHLESAWRTEKDAWAQARKALRQYRKCLHDAVGESRGKGYSANLDNVNNRLNAINDNHESARQNLDLARRHIRVAQQEVDLLEKIHSLPPAGTDVESIAAYHENIARLLRQRANTAMETWNIAGNDVELKRREIARLESQPLGSYDSKKREEKLQEAEELLETTKTWSLQTEIIYRSLENKASIAEKRAKRAREEFRKIARRQMSKDIVRWTSAVIFFVLTVWLAIWTTGKMKQTEAWLKEQSPSEEKARRIHTPYLMIRRILVPTISVIGAVIVLVHFEGFRQWGLTFLASAGVVSIIFGFAARGSFENFIAGLTLCFAQPIRINDSVRIDGELGTIEDIGLIYTTFRVWDNRRILIPNEAMARKPIDNYTIRGADLLPKIPFHLDPEADLDRAAEILKDVVRSSSHWSGKEDPQIWFMQATENAVEVWVAGWARNASEGWALRSEVLQVGLQRLKQAGIQFPLTRVEMEKPPPTP